MLNRSTRLCAPLAVGLLALTACGTAGPGAAQPGHIPVSTPTAMTEATKTPDPVVTATGVLTDPLLLTNFGMHVGSPDNWPELPMGAFRIWNADSTWGSLEKSPGSWTFDALDTRVDLAEAAGAPILLVLAMPPAWAASRPELKSYGGSPSMPTDVEDWRTYVRTVAERYAGRIESYEIWNEPNLTQFWASSPEEMTTLTESAAEEIRAADPAALVVSPGLSGRTAGSTTFFTAYTAGLSPESIDVVGLHVYPYPGDGPESMIEMATGFRTLADDAGLADKPMWNTEIGYGRTPDSIFTGDVAAALILRTYLVLPSIGIPRNYWYMWDDRAWVGLYLVGSDRRTPTESAYDYVRAQRWLAGASLLGCNDVDGLWTCQLIREGIRVTIIWSLTGEQLVDVPPGSHEMYAFGSAGEPVDAGTTAPVGDLPVLFSPVAIPELED